MLTIRNIELSRTYIGGDYRRPKFQTVAEVKIGEGYQPTVKITLTDEQTDKAVAFILGLIRESLTVEMEKLEPVEDAVEIPAPEFVEPVPVLEPL